MRDYILVKTFISCSGHQVLDRLVKYMIYDMKPETQCEPRLHVNIKYGVLFVEEKKRTNACHSADCHARV